MITMTPRGLGAYPPPIPPRTHEALQAGNEWHRILEGSRQRQDCPAGSGCTLITEPDMPWARYAWGQRPIPQSEFTSPPTASTSTIGFQAAPVAAPATLDEAKAMCVALREWWERSNPEDAKCLTRQHKRNFRRYCMKWLWHKEWTQAQAVARIQEMVDAACGRVNVPPPQPSAVTPGPDAQPAPGPPAHDPFTTVDPGVGPEDLPGPSGNGNGNGYVAPISEPSSLRVWGPVLGLGLVAAIALTALRKRKKRR